MTFLNVFSSIFQLYDFIPQLFLKLLSKPLFLHHLPTLVIPQTDARHTQWRHRYFSCFDWSTQNDGQAYDWSSTFIMTEFSLVCLADRATRHQPSQMMKRKRMKLSKPSGYVHRTICTNKFMKSLIFCLVPECPTCQGIARQIWRMGK